MLKGTDTSKTGRKVKRDGQYLRPKQVMIDDYDQSYLPYPLKNLIKLDYCWKLNYTLFHHSLYQGVPLSGIYFIYTTMPGCWDYTFKTFPFKKLV